MPKSGPAPKRPKAVFLPNQNAGMPWPPSITPLLDGLHHLQPRDHGAGRQHLDLQAPAGHLEDLLRVVDGELVVDELHRPGALEAQRDRRRLRARDGREAAERGACARCGEEPPARGRAEFGFRFGIARHDDLPGRWVGRSCENGGRVVVGDPGVAHARGQGCILSIGKLLVNMDAVAGRWHFRERSVNVMKTKAIVGAVRRRKSFPKRSSDGKPGKAMKAAILVYEGTEPIDLATYGVLSMARRVAPQVSMFLVAEKAGPVALANGLTVVAAPRLRRRAGRRRPRSSPAARAGSARRARRPRSPSCAATARASARPRCAPAA